MENIKHKETIKDIVEGKVKCPLDVSIIPNYMGINLVSVHSIEWERQPDGQLVKVTINFIPEIKDDQDVGKNYESKPNIF